MRSGWTVGCLHRIVLGARCLHEFIPRGGGATSQAAQVPEVTPREGCSLAEAEYSVETHNLTKRFGDFTAVDGIDLQVGPYPPAAVNARPRPRSVGPKHPPASDRSLAPSLARYVRETATRELIRER